ncbi:MAG: hypothetical protein GY822_21710 [Deltaproteobacteria bacterium]|nr:hypothetical protein [Deltaproteobacteria bacterium]
MQFLVVSLRKGKKPFPQQALFEKTRDDAMNKRVVNDDKTPPQISNSCPPEN